MKKSYFLLMAFILLGSGTVINAQGISISSAGNVPDPSAALDIQDTAKGLLIPRITGAKKNAIANPATGLIIYQTDSTTGLWYNAGTPAAINWVQLVPNPANSVLNMTSNIITNLPAPIAGSDAANKNYVDNAVAAAGGPAWTNFQEFISTSGSFTFTIPSTITLIKVQVWGAGGGGGASGGGGGGGGGYSEGIYTVSPNTSYNVTIGAGGAGGISGGSAGTTGGASSFGSLISASGGNGAANSNVVSGQGGWGVGGSVNTTLGSGGNPGLSYYSYGFYAGQPGTNGGGSGGTSIGGSNQSGGGGGGGVGGGNGGSGTTAGNDAIPNSGAGGGGGGTGFNGGNGATGRVVVYW